MTFLKGAPLLLMLLFSLAALPGCDDGLFTNCKADEIDCGNDNCCPAGAACCITHEKCCAPTLPHHCQETGRCYRFLADAQADCGEGVEVCGSPAAALLMTVRDSSTTDVLWMPETACEGI